MKNYTITVNGTAYDVTVEENTGSPAVQAAPAAVQPPSLAAPKAEQKVTAKAPTGNAGAVKVNAPMPGKILSLKANVGQTVKRGDVLLVLEAMKMENEIVAPQDGSVASLNVAIGDMVEAGVVLATLN